MSLAEIKEAVAQLQPEELAELTAFVCRRDGEAWDRQIAEDSAAGRHDHLISEIEAEIAEGRTRPLSEVLDDH